MSQLGFLAVNLPLPSFAQSKSVVHLLENKILHIHLLNVENMDFYAAGSRGNCYQIN